MIKHTWSQHGFVFFILTIATVYHGRVGVYLVVDVGPPQYHDDQQYHAEQDVPQSDVQPDVRPRVQAFRWSHVPVKKIIEKMIAIYFCFQTVILVPVLNIFNSWFDCICSYLFQYFINGCKKYYFLTKHVCCLILLSNCDSCSKRIKTVNENHSFKTCMRWNSVTVWILQ